MLDQSRRFLTFGILGIWLFRALVPFAYATDYSGSSFTIQDPVQNSLGSDATSSSFHQIDSGSLSVQGGESVGSSFKVQTGNLYFSSSTQLLTQNTYRWYANMNSSAVWSPLAAQNATISDIDMNDVIRLRIGLKATSADVSGKVFKLQFGEAINNVCTGVSSWTDLGGLSAPIMFRGYDNNGATDGFTLAQGMNLLTTGVNGVSGTYEEENPSATMPNTITTGTNTDGEWDWSIINYGGTAGEMYCFRMVYSDGTALNAYTNYPTLTTLGEALTYSLSTNTVNLGPLSSNEIIASTYDVTVSTTSSTGYAIHLKANGPLTSGSYAIPGIIGGTVTAGSEAYGVRTNYNDFSQDAALDQTDKIARSYSSAIQNHATSIQYKIAISPSTPTGTYSQTLTTTVSAMF